MSDTVAATSVAHSMPSLSELSSVTLRAAIQLDLMLRERAADDAPLKKLSESLRGASELPGGGTALSLHFNPVALGVLNRAVEQTERRSLKTVAELVHELAEFADILVKEPAARNKETISRSLSFCLSLHRELVAELSQSDVIVPSDDWTGARL